MGEPPLSAFAKRRIASLAQHLLTASGAMGVVPTPIDAVQRAAGVRERIDIADLPPELAALKPAGLERVLGATWLDERAVFVDASQPAPRRLFTEAHETAHLMCGWHRDALMVDTEATLFRETRLRLEAEANYGASCLIFQRPDFARRALGQEISIEVPLALADVYGASRHSALHVYVEEHPAPVALLVAGRYPNPYGDLPIWRTVESQSFLRRFGPLRSHLREGRVSTLARGDDPLSELLSGSAHGKPSPRVGLALHEPGRGRRVGFHGQAFFNGRCHFVLIGERAARAPRAPRARARALGSGLPGAAVAGRS